MKNLKKLTFLFLPLLVCGCARKIEIHEHNQLTKYSIDGVYEVCCNDDCVTPYGLEPISSRHDFVKVQNGKFLHSKRGVMSEMCGEEFVNSGLFSMDNCDYEFKVIRLLYTINKNDTLPFH